MTQPQTGKAKRSVAILTRSVIGVAALLAAVVIAVALMLTAPEPEAGEGEVVATNVPVIELKPVTLGRQWRGLGPARAVDEASVAAQVTAQVIDIPQGIDDGVTVERGQVLARLDPEDFEHQAAITRANLRDIAARLEQLDTQQARLIERRALEEQLVEIAVSERQRVERLYDSDAAGRQGLDQARRQAIEAQRAMNATLEQLDAIEPRRAQLQAQHAREQASLERALLNVRRCTIRSPIGGMIQSMQVEVGEHVSPGQPVARIVGLSRIEVALSVPASARADLARGDPVTIHDDGGAGRTWEAAIGRILPESDPATRTVTCIIEIEQPDAPATFGTPEGQGLLMPGTFVSAVVTGAEPKPRWVVPRRAVRHDRVLLVRDGVIESRPVRIAFSHEGQIPRFGLSDDQWLVLEADPPPVQAGDWLVVNASPALRDGVRIEPMLVNAEAEEAGATPAESESSRPAADTPGDAS